MIHSVVDSWIIHSYKLAVACRQRQKFEGEDVVEAYDKTNKEIMKLLMFIYNRSFLPESCASGKQVNPAKRRA